MRRFDAEYLRFTRRGMWDDAREALAPLELDDRASILELGAGHGALTDVLEEESDPDTAIVALDVDRELLEGLSGSSTIAQPVLGDARAIPLSGDSVDLAVCQALLINVSDPIEVVEEFARTSSELVGAIEPNNAEVEVTSTVDGEATLDRRARRRFLEGVHTDVTLGGDGTRRTFEAAGLTGITTRRYVHEKVIEPPYARHSLRDARRKATGREFDRRRNTLLAGGLSNEGFERLRDAWREVGHGVIEQMQRGTYRRTEQVPYYVTVAHVDHGDEPAER